jgi:hypothetical protein
VPTRLHHGDHRVEDDEPAEYRITVRWFVASVVVLGGALVGAAAVYAGML